jgi:hypothetical protein
MREPPGKQIPASAPSVALGLTSSFPIVEASVPWRCSIGDRACRIQSTPLFNPGQRLAHELCDDPGMRIRVARLAFAILVAVSLQAALGAQPQKKQPPTSTPLGCGDLVGFQVLLDRQGFSPGQIDGLPGANFSHARDHDLHGHER